MGEAPVDAAGERHGRGDKISPDQARPMRQIRMLQLRSTRRKDAPTAWLEPVDRGTRALPSSRQKSGRSQLVTIQASDLRRSRLDPRVQPRPIDCVNGIRILIQFRHRVSFHVPPTRLSKEGLAHGLEAI